ncbi:hypothetical protein [Burkholderia pseudomallei]|uniref:hypothetical protein n=1 Tax=Burkholderia pseudomallei TaxID=28450 RepID=UPI002952EC0C|nr:hypothetical protein [Burkholderia pseudomallei]
MFVDVARFDRAVAGDRHMPACFGYRMIGARVRSAGKRHRPACRFRGHAARRALPTLMRRMRGDIRRARRRRTAGRECRPPDIALDRARIA